MTISEIYEFFIREGIREDLRTKAQIDRSLKAKRSFYNRLTSQEKRFFDKESFKNPFADTRILHGDRKKKVRRILVGIDIEPGELVLADSLASKGKSIDLVLAHHPEGIALAGLDDCMHLQTDVLKNLGLRSDVAEKLMNKRIDEVSRSLHSVNHSRSVDAAKLLDVPYMCCHTPADNHVARYLQKKMNRRKPKSLKQIINLLNAEPEYKEAIKHKAGPEILVGKSNAKAGTIFVDMTGGTEGSKDIFARLSQLGIDTILGMHFSQAHFDRMKAECLNVVNAGHIASDNLGINLLLDKLQKKTKIEIIECSGFRRFRR